MRYVGYTNRVLSLPTQRNEKCDQTLPHPGLGVQHLRMALNRRSRKDSLAGESPENESGPGAAAEPAVVQIG